MMPHIALPLSTLYYENEAFAKARLLPLAGELEVRDFTYGEIPGGLPLHFHSDLGLVNSGFTTFFRDGFWELMDRYRVGRLSLDLGPATPESIAVFPLATPMSPAEIMDRCKENMAFLRRQFAGEILLETLPYYRTGLYEHVCTPPFIAAALEELDAGLLLDLSHVEVSAYNLGMTVGDYLDGLPLHRVGHVHLSKTFVADFQAVDAHLCPDEKEFELLQSVMGCFGETSFGVSIEYYKDGPRLEGACRALNAMLATGTAA